MLRRLSVLLVAALVAAVLTSAPASAATYSVTIKLSAVKADVGKTVTISGSVSGSKAAKKSLLVQRKVGSGAWKKIGSVKTTSKKKYTYKHKVSTAGAQQFRVVAPKKGSTKQGVSPAKSFAGWRWLNLAEQPTFVYGAAAIDTNPTILGKKRPHSIEVYPNSFGATHEGVSWTLSELCDKSDIKAALYAVAGSNTSDLYSSTDGGGSTISVTATELKTSNVVSSASQYLQIENEGLAYTVVLVSPRIHCSVNRVPDPIL